jgi:photosystem II stability/assembly factor-like uncharacterized protein
VSASLSLGDTVLGQAGSNVSQPFGICRPTCQPTTATCQAKTACAALYDLASKRPTGTFACLPYAKQGESCANNATCNTGLTCIRYGTTAPSWLCQTPCTSNDDCQPNQQCAPASSTQPQKVCKQRAKQAAPCGPGVICEAGTTCVPSQLQEPARCLPKCDQTKPTTCAGNERCQSFVTLDHKTDHACMRKAGLYEPCRNGATCDDPTHLCIGITNAYAACFPSCQTHKDCPQETLCDTISDASTIKVCRKQIKPGQQFLNLSQCENGGRALRLRPQQPPICLPDCTSGTTLAPEYCGTLTTNTLRSCHFLQGQEWYAAGSPGRIVYTNDNGRTWSRLSSATLDQITESTPLSASQLLAVSQNGTWMTQTKGATGWTPLQQTAQTDGALYGVTKMAGADSVIAVGTNGIWLNESPFDSPQKQPTPQLVGALRAVASEPKKTDGTKAVLLAAGEKGELLRSSDAGTTWTRVTPTNITTNWRAVTWHRGTSNKAFDALVVGDNGAIYRSQDRGTTWSAMKSNTTNHLLGVASIDNVTLVVGENGTVLQWKGNAWHTVTLPTTLSPPALHAVAIKDNVAIAVGSGGVALWSDDGGSKWTYTTSQLLACLPIQLPAAADVGACVLLCNPTKQGKDCPTHLPVCGTIEINDNTQHVCMPTTQRNGTAKEQSPCSPYEGAPATMRCQDGLQCVQLTAGHVCLRPCKQSNANDCPTGTRCLQSPEAKGSYCGKEAAQGKLCAPEKALFCPPNTHCLTDPATQELRCIARQTRQKGQFCLVDNPHMSCDSTLICSGSAATPYRHTCTNRCNWESNTGCASGWTCLPNTDGIGSCVEVCKGEGDSCQTKGLRCRRPFATSKTWFCL